MIEIHSLTKTFDKIKAVDDVSVMIKNNTVFGLIGTNGAGKSTVLRMISGVLKPDSGTVTVDNMPVYDNVEAKKKLFFIADEPYFFANSNAKVMEKYYSGVYENFNREEFYRYLESFNLDKNRKIGTFSKGMKKQLALLLGICAHTDYILCDETFDGLDPITREITKKVFMEEMLDNNATILMSSHNLREMEDICDRIVLIDRGKLVLSADLEDLRDTVSKYQVLLNEDIGERAQEIIAVVNPRFIGRSGRMITFIAEGTSEAVEQKLTAAAAEKNCALSYIEALPLSLEEIFMYKVKESGMEMGGLVSE